VWIVIHATYLPPPDNPGFPSDRGLPEGIDLLSFMESVLPCPFTSLVAYSPAIFFTPERQFTPLRSVAWRTPTPFSPPLLLSLLVTPKNLSRIQLLPRIYPVYARSSPAFHFPALHPPCLMPSWIRPCIDRGPLPSSSIVSGFWH